MSRIWGKIAPTKVWPFVSEHFNGGPSRVHCIKISRRWPWQFRAKSCPIMAGLCLKTIILTYVSLLFLDRLWIWRGDPFLICCSVFFRHLFMCRLHKLGVAHWCDVCVYVAIAMRLLYMSVYVAIVLQFLNFRHDRRWQAHPWQGLIQPELWLRIRKLEAQGPSNFYF